MFVCALYNLLTFPETSSAHGMSRMVNIGLPFAIFRRGFNMFSLAHTGEQSIKLGGEIAVMAGTDLQLTSK